VHSSKHAKIKGLKTVVNELLNQTVMEEHNSSMKELDQWIEELNKCRPLAENQIKTLCEKVIV